MTPPSSAVTRITSTVGVTTTVVVGVPVLLAELVGTADELIATRWWWGAYLLMLVPFTAGSLAWREPARVIDDRVVLACMTLGGLAAVATAPGYGFAIALPIVTACAADHIIGLRSAAALVVAQAVVIGVVLGVHDGVLTFAVVQALTWGGFMAFGVTTVEASRREAASRKALGTTNAQLVEANARLADANARLLHAQRELAASSRTEERLRIARDLHDALGHQLTALSLQLESAVHRVEGPGSDEVTRARALTRQLLDDVRRVVGRLRENAADDARATAVDELERIRAAVDVPRVDLQLDPEDLPDDALRADVVVRTVQEAVTNAVRHAQASTVSVVIRRTGDAAASLAQPSRIRTLVRVSDDGLGVNELVAGNGLRGMAERLDAAGGTLRIHTRVGAGVRIQAEVPWADHSAPGAKRPADQRVVDAAAAP